MFHQIIKTKTFTCPTELLTPTTWAVGLSPLARLILVYIGLYEQCGLVAYFGQYTLQGALFATPRAVREAIAELTSNGHLRRDDSIWTTTHPVTDQVTNVPAAILIAPVRPAIKMLLLLLGNDAVANVTMNQCLRFAGIARRTYKHFIDEQTLARSLGLPSLIVTGFKRPRVDMAAVLTLKPSKRGQDRKNEDISRFNKWLRNNPSDPTWCDNDQYSDGEDMRDDELREHCGNEAEPMPGTPVPAHILVAEFLADIDTAKQQIADSHAAGHMHPLMHILLTPEVSVALQPSRQQETTAA